MLLVLALCIVCTVDGKAFQASDGTYNGEYDHIYQNMYAPEYAEQPQPYQNHPNYQLTEYAEQPQPYQNHPNYQSKEYAEQPQPYQNHPNYQSKEYAEQSHPYPNDPNYELKYIPHVEGQPIFIPPVEPVHYQTAVPVSSNRRKNRPKHGYTKYPDLTSHKKMIDEDTDAGLEIFSDPQAPEQEAFAEKPYGHDSKRKHKIKKIPSGKYNHKLYSSKDKSYPKEKNDLKKDKVVEKKSDYPVQDEKFADVPIVHVKSISPEQDYDLPLVEGLDTSNEADYEDSEIPEEINQFRSDHVEYDFEHPEIVDAALNSKPGVESSFDEDEQVEISPLKNSHQIDDQNPNLDNEADYDYSSDEQEALTKQKNKNDKQGYPDSEMIKKQNTKSGHKTKTAVKTPVKFPSVHMSDYAYEASKKTPPEHIKKPIKSSIKVKPTKKPHVPKTVDKDLKYEDTLKQEPVKIIKKPNTHSKPVLQKPIKHREHVVDDDEDDLDDEDYEIPDETIDEFKNEEFDDPSVVEALVKKPISKDEGYPDYDSPKVVEALTKKKPSKKGEHKEIKASNIKAVYKHDKQKGVKGTAKDDHKKADLEYKNLKKDAEVIELHHQREGPVFLGLNQDDVEKKEVLSEDLTQPENDPENINENDSLDMDGGLNSGRSGNFEDARSLFLKSNVWSFMSNFHSQERNKFKPCKTPDNEPGNCMPIQMCPVPNLDLTLDDFTKKVCTIDNVFIGICCPQFPAETLKVKWDNLTESPVDIKEKTMEPKECGEMQGSVDNLHSWPWMTPLISVSTRRIFCGGVLIKAQYVLTAAHCTRKIPHNQILAILGPMSSKQDPTNQEFAVVEIKRHAQYNPRTMQNDIALLKLSKPVVLNDLRRFICLPKEEANFIDEEALLLGWQGSFEASKNEESLRVISPEDCRKGVRMVIGPNVLCTEPRTEDIMCNLDSGAPLIVKEDGKYVVIGILSWNRNDCDSDFPAIFTRVSHFRKWIDNHAV